MVCAEPIDPAQPAPGVRVVVLSPSGGLPALFLARFELGCSAYRTSSISSQSSNPTTRAMHAAPRAGADVLHAAFPDPDIAAAIVSVGGDDQLKVLRHLDPDVLRANTKRLFGYGDNTNLLHYLSGSSAVGGPAVHADAPRPEWLAVRLKQGGACLPAPPDQSERHACKRHACERQQRQNRRQGRAGAATSAGVNAGRHLDAADSAVVTGLLARHV